jgi:hypothetical protein
MPVAAERDGEVGEREGEGTEGADGQWPGPISPLLYLSSVDQVARIALWTVLLSLSHLVAPYVMSWASAVAIVALTALASAPRLMLSFAASSCSRSFSMPFDESSFFRMLTAVLAELTVTLPRVTGRYFATSLWCVFQYPIVSVQFVVETTGQLTVTATDAAAIAVAPVVEPVYRAVLLKEYAPHVLYGPTAIAYENVPASPAFTVPSARVEPAAVSVTATERSTSLSVAFANENGADAAAERDP